MQCGSGSGLLLWTVTVLTIFPCAVREAAAFCDSGQYRVDDQIRGRIMCGASDDEAAHRMFEVKDLTLQRAIVDICRTCENAGST